VIVSGSMDSIDAVCSHCSPPQRRGGRVHLLPSSMTIRLQWRHMSMVALL